MNLGLGSILIRGIQGGAALVSLLVFLPLNLMGQSPSASPHKNNQLTREDVVLIDGTPVPALFADAINSVKVPEAENGWVVQVITRGGFNGTGRGDIAITSKGTVNCTPPHAKCKNELTHESLQGLAQIVTQAKPSIWGGSTVGNCMDCYVMLLALRRRGADGKEQAYFAFWDDTTQKNAPFEAKWIFDRVVALTK